MGASSRATREQEREDRRDALCQVGVATLLFSREHGQCVLCLKKTGHADVCPVGAFEKRWGPIEAVERA